MALVWVEDGASRSATIVRIGRKATATYVKSWKIFGSSDDLEVHREVNRAISENYLYWDYPGTDGEARLEFDTYSLEYLGDDAWQLTANYSKEGFEEQGSPQPIRRSRSFDTAGGQEHITQAIASKVSKQGSSNAPYSEKVIGFDGENVNGVDIIVPQLSWTENYEIPDSFFRPDYIRIVSQATGSTNKATFRGFEQGEVLFLGCSGSQEWDEGKGPSPWVLSYKFSISPNAGFGSSVPAIQVGDVTNVNKRGHEYLHTYYEDSVSDNRIFKVPKLVYVHQVYPETDFSLLGIGVGVD